MPYGPQTAEHGNRFDRAGLEPGASRTTSHYREIDHNPSDEEGVFLSFGLALVALCSASSPLPGSGLNRAAAAATDPVSNPQPASTLLAPGTTGLDLSVDSAVATDCAWSLGTAKSYAEMTAFSSGTDTSHLLHERSQIAKSKQHPAIAIRKNRRSFINTHASTIQLSTATSTFTATLNQRRIRRVSRNPPRLTSSSRCVRS